MIIIRHFTERDAIIIQHKQYPEVPITDLREMISEWNTCSYDGKYFEMFAITSEDEIVGNVSLYQHTKSIVSIGVEVFPEERKRGYGFEGMRLVIDYARVLGYRVIQDQVRTDNRASIALHNKLEFETDGYVFKNAKGKDVLLYVHCL